MKNIVTATKGLVEMIAFWLLKAVGTPAVSVETAMKASEKATASFVARTEALLQEVTAKAVAEREAAEQLVVRLTGQIESQRVMHDNLWKEFVRVATPVVEDELVLTTEEEDAAAEAADRLETLAQEGYDYVLVDSEESNEEQEHLCCYCEKVVVEMEYGVCATCQPLIDEINAQDSLEEWEAMGEVECDLTDEELDAYEHLTDGAARQLQQNLMRKHKGTVNGVFAVGRVVNGQMSVTTTGGDTFLI